MSVLMQIDFPYTGPFGEEMTQSMNALAESISKEEGLIWKIWTENAKTKEAGGIYLFQNQEYAEKYLKMHTERLSSFGIHGVNAKFFSINLPLSKITQATFNLI